MASFQTSNTNRAAKPPQERGDIDLQAQRAQLKAFHDTRRYKALMQEYHGTCADRSTHIRFLKMLLSEAQRQRAINASPANAALAPQCAALFNEKKLKQTTEKVSALMADKQQDNYLAALALISGERLFTTRY